MSCNHERINLADRQQDWQPPPGGSIKQAWADTLGWIESWVVGGGGWRGHTDQNPPCLGWWRSCPCTPLRTSATLAPPTAACRPAPPQGPAACCCGAGKATPDAWTAPLSRRLATRNTQRDLKFRSIKGSFELAKTLPAGVKAGR